VTNARVFDIFFCFYPATRSTGRHTKFTVVFSFIMYGYGYGFLSRGFTDRREILHGGSATSQTGFVVFLGGWLSYGLQQGAVC